MLTRPGFQREPICTWQFGSKALDAVIVDGGVQSSNSRLFKGAIFGRDSLEVALAVVEFLPALAERILFGLLGLVGTAHNPVTEEQPGRVHHEHRRLYFGGRRVEPEVEERFYQIAEDFGLSTEGGQWTYYAALDTTPNLVRLIGRLYHQQGPALLDRRYISKDGAKTTVRSGLLSLMGWIVAALERSELGLVEFQRTNPSGLRWHVMRDGATSHLHQDGRLANLDAPIAPLDVQALAYDALLVAGDILSDSALAPQWEWWSGRLRQNTLEQFWTGEQFAMAVDRDEAGLPRRLLTSSSVQAELLDTKFFSGLSEDQQQLYVSSIVRLMYSREFLTEVGIRMRGLSYADILPYPDYQGSEVSWIVTTERFARGLRAHGLPELAIDQESRYLTALDVAQQFYEFLYVRRDGVPAFFVQDAVPAPGFRVIAATNLPENVQAWTVSSVLRALHDRQKPALATVRPEWKNQLVADIDLQLQVPYTFYIDTEEGKRLEREFLR